MPMALPVNLLTIVPKNTQTGKMHNDMFAVQVVITVLHISWLMSQFNKLAIYAR